MVDRFSALRGDHGNYRFEAALHGRGGTDFLPAKVVRDHGRGDGRASVVGASVAVGYRSGIRVVDWDSCYCFSGNFRHIHGDSGRGTGVDGIGVQWLVGKITVYFHASRCHGHSDIDCFHVDSRYFEPCHGRYGARVVQFVFHVAHRVCVGYRE